MRVKITIEVTKEDVVRIQEGLACFYPEGMSHEDLENAVLEEVYADCADYLEDAILIFEE